jgi:hypothetical protein
MANNDIDAVKKRKNAECNKQYRSKRKLLTQRQASTSTETISGKAKEGITTIRVTCVSLA